MLNFNVDLFQLLMNETNFDQVHAQCIQSIRSILSCKLIVPETLLRNSLAPLDLVTVRNESTLAQRNSHFSWVCMNPRANIFTFST